MGTSASVSGAGPGSPLIPDWVEDVESSEPGSQDEDSSTPPNLDSSIVAVPGAPRARLAGARRNLGKFATDGDRDSLRRGVADYVRSGRGGAALATRRSAGSARRAGTLAGIAGGGAQYQEVRNRIRETLASSGDPQEILAAIAAEASPNDGTLDSETGRRAAAEALQHVLKEFPDADVFDLDASQREVLLERFLAIDCFELFFTEVGKHVQAKVDLATAATRIREIKEYFCETFRHANANRRASGSPSLGALTDQKLGAICRDVIADAYMTFEAYLDES